MEIRENSVLPMCAVEFALKEHNYIPRVVMEELIPLLSQLSEEYLADMSEEIGEHLDKCKEDSAWTLDDYDWRKFREAIERERKRRDLHRD